MCIDLVAVTVFALLGRAAHHRVLDLLGVLETAWPFVVSLIVGHLATHLIVGSWRNAAVAAVWPAGVIIWAVTAVLGLTIRVVAGGGAPLAFVVVTAVVLLVTMVGWRLLRQGQQAMRRRRTPRD